MSKKKWWVQPPRRVHIAELRQYDCLYVSSPYQHHIEAARVTAWLTSHMVTAFSPAAYAQSVAAKRINNLSLNRLMMGLSKALVVIACDGWDSNPDVLMEVNQFKRVMKPVYKLDPATLKVHEFSAVA